MHRMGLVDFWCYENDELYFSDGHMLLRGSNGSGKSVTMQSFIPLLLDGNRSSERLDPFGTRSRKMDTYLIDENTDRDERIGYLYLEFKREESEIYKTIGMGMRARRNKPLDVWYFVIEDNRRINIDFSLMSQHLTLSKKQLENILGDQVITGQGEYMRKVNEALFGFDNVDDYKDAIDLLLQLRSPKLSNSLSPSKINEILATSLQPLSEEDLRPMSDAITSMDNLQDDLENLNNCLSAAKKIAQAYQVYNQVILIDKWNKYQRENENYQTIEKDIHNKEADIQQFKAEYAHLQENLSQYQIQLEVFTKEKSLLTDPHMERLHEELMTLKKHIQELHQQISYKQNQCETKEDRIIDLKNDIENYENKIYQAQKDNLQAFRLLEDIYESFPFSEHSALKEALSQHQDFEFEYTKRRLKEEHRQTQNVLSLFDHYDQQLLQVQHIENEMIHFYEQLEKTQQSLEESKKQYAQCVVEYQEYFYKYNDQNQVLKLSRDDIQTMTDLLSDYEITKDYHSIYALVHHHYMKQYEEFMKEKGLLEIEKHQY